MKSFLFFTFILFVIIIIYLVLKKEKYLTPVVKDFISFITDQSEFA